MTGSNQFSLFLLQVAATVALSMAAVEGVNYAMSTPVESSIYTVISQAPGHVGPAPVSDTMQRGGMTPFVETTAIALDKDILAALKKTPLRQISVQAIGTSWYAYNMVFNGQIVPSVYSTIGERESMYFLDISGDTPRLWISERAAKNWAPSTVAYVINKDLKRFASTTSEVAAAIGK